MDKRVFFLREYLKKRRYKVKRIHKEWVGFGTGLKAVLSDLFIVLQLVVIIAIYAYLTYRFNALFQVCVGLTVLTAVYVLVYEPDLQSKISWTLLFLISFGSGFIIYLLSRKSVCYAIKRLRFKKISKRVKTVERETDLGEVAVAEYKRELPVEDYLNSNGFATYTATRGKYYANTRNVMDNFVARVSEAKKFVFIQFFITADGVYLERLVSAFREITEAGVEVYMAFDSVGSAGVLSNAAQQRLKDAGAHLAEFQPLFRPFSFGLNYRDHRKIVVVDGETAYLGGFNLIDDCANQRKMEGLWKDAGVRLEGAAVDGLSVEFMRQWELSTGDKLDAEKYLNHYKYVENSSRFIPYAGGPEIKEPVCRGVYEKIMVCAREKLYIMTPYLVPDSKLMNLLKQKVKEGVDVRLVLPGVPDYRYIYRVTVSNARKLIKSGVKVYYSGGEFVHSKVMLSESCAAVGSVNLDMRAFYQEFDNGVVTDDEEFMGQAGQDFKWLFERNNLAERGKNNPVNALITGVFRLVAPLM